MPQCGLIGRASGMIIAQASQCPQVLATLGCGSGGELCEVGGGSPVDFRHRVGVVPQCGRSAEATAELTRRAAGVARELAARQARAAAARRAREDLARPLARPPTIESADGRRENCQLLREHVAFRYDPFPPWTDPDTWWYLCDGCGDDRITGAKLKASSVIHVVATYERTSTGRYKTVHRRYGAGISEPGQGQPERG